MGFASLYSSYGDDDFDCYGYNADDSDYDYDNDNDNDPSDKHGDA